MIANEVTTIHKSLERERWCLRWSYRKVVFSLSWFHKKMLHFQKTSLKHKFQIEGNYMLNFEEV